MKTSTLTSYIVKFNNLNDKNLQLDFFRGNKQVVLQIFKGYDVRLWNIDFEVKDYNSYILNLHFNKGKTNNKLNYDRFMNSSYFNKFKLVKVNKIFTNYFEIGQNESIEFVENTILDIIRVIYDIDLNEVEFTLNAY